VIAAFEIARRGVCQKVIDADQNPFNGQSFYPVFQFQGIASLNWGEGKDEDNLF
jgi:hypothetical protein